MALTIRTLSNVGDDVVVVAVAVVDGLDSDTEEVDARASFNCAFSLPSPLQCALRSLMSTITSISYADASLSHALLSGLLDTEGIDDMVDVDVEVEVEVDVDVDVDAVADVDGVKSVSESAAAPGGSAAHAIRLVSSLSEHAVGKAYSSASDVSTRSDAEGGIFTGFS